MNDFFLQKHGFLHGCDYNPEQWLNYPEILEQDIEYMKKANCNVMSIGIFSWSFLEPNEGKYNFEYFDRIVEKLTNNNIKIILATPSGARPRWLSEKYPEVLRVNSNNVKKLYGLRHNHCYTSPIYRKKVANIDRLLAERYANNANVILWHISNEYGGECHCELCQKAFRDWLKNKYHNSLDELNEAWWTGFWSHTVFDWSQINSPVENGEWQGTLSGLYLDWKEFVTYQTTDFMKMEIDAVKAINPNIPVTTNMMDMNQKLDYSYMKDFIDVISWDSYPAWHGKKTDWEIACLTAFNHDYIRALKKKPFLLMESTPSLVSWTDFNKLKRPGMHKLSSIQAVAHGSDSVQYFQWRKGRGGCEKFHGAVIDHNLKATGRVFEDVKNLGSVLKNIGEIAGSNVNAEVALIYDYKNRWAIENASGFALEDKKYLDTCVNHYKEFWKRGINVDIIHSNADISKYKLLVIPMLYLITEEQISKIEGFVSNGGTVIATYMTGYVNETDLCYLGGFPGGKLKEVFGLTADEIDTLYPNEKNEVMIFNKEYEVVDYCEIITSTTAEVIGTYSTDFYMDSPAILKNKYNNGTAYYIGCRDNGALLGDFYKSVLNECNIACYNLPDGVTVHSRTDEENEYLFVENYTEKQQNIYISFDCLDMETGKIYDGKVEEHNVKILKVLK